ncbi:MAG: AraC family transcriptional regulator [Anaerocolumna sp.]|nr:AraC family transcriptional regulator [Anaerocolumna sp.]
MHKEKVYHTSRSKGFFIDFIKRITPYQMESKHYHDQYEIYYLISGDRNYFIQDRVYHVEKGDLIIIRPNILHKTVDATPSSHERILIEFDTSLFDDFLANKEIELLDIFYKDCSILHLEELEKEQIEHCFYKLIQETKNNGADNNTALKVYFLELLIHINRFYKELSALQHNHPSKLHKRISEVITYINLNYRNDIGLELLSKEFLISTAHLSRAFKKVTGLSYIEYLNNLRVNEAQKLLTETNLSIFEIAERVGYQNSTHFGRIFKSITGSSPREFRKLLVSWHTPSA